MCQLLNKHWRLSSQWPLRGQQYYPHFLYKWKNGLDWNSGGSSPIACALKLLGRNISQSDVNSWQVLIILSSCLLPALLPLCDSSGPYSFPLPAWPHLRQSSLHRTGWFFLPASVARLVKSTLLVTSQCPCTQVSLESLLCQLPPLPPDFSLTVPLPEIHTHPCLNLSFKAQVDGYFFQEGSLCAPSLSPILCQAWGNPFLWCHNPPTHSFFLFLNHIYMYICLHDEQKDQGTCQLCSSVFKRRSDSTI